MAQLGVGIHPNVVISKVETSKDDKDQLLLDVTFKESGVEAAKEKDTDSLDFLNSGEVVNSNGPRESKIRFYPKGLAKYDGGEKSGDELLLEILGPPEKDGGVQGQLVQILNTYMTSDKIKFDLLKGITGIKTKSDLAQKVVKQDTLDKLQENMFTQFSDMMQPVIGDNSKKVQVKFIRKSDASNFPALVAKKLNWNPFIVAMDDEAGLKKMKYSQWEIDNNKNSNAQTLGSADIDPADLAAQNEAVNSVFG